MKTKVIVPIALMTLSSISYAEGNECNFLLERTEKLGIKTSYDLEQNKHRALKAQLNQCLDENPKERESRKYIAFMERTSKEDSARAREKRKQDRHKQKLEDRKFKTFGPSDLTKYGSPLVAYEVAYQNSTDLDSLNDPRVIAKGLIYKTSVLVRITDANDFCESKGFQKADLAIVDASYEKENRVTRLYNMASKIVSPFGFGNTAKRANYSKDDSEDINNEDTRRPRHALVFNQIRCVKTDRFENRSNTSLSQDDIMEGSTDSDDLKDIQTTVILQTKNGIEKPIDGEKEEIELEMSIKRFLHGSLTEEVNTSRGGQDDDYDNSSYDDDGDDEIDAIINGRSY